MTNLARQYLRLIEERERNIRRAQRDYQERVRRAWIAHVLSTRPNGGRAVDRSTIIASRDSIGWQAFGKAPKSRERLDEQHRLFAPQRERIARDVYTEAMEVD